MRTRPRVALGTLKDFAKEVHVIANSHAGEVAPRATTSFNASQHLHDHGRNAVSKTAL